MAGYMVEVLGWAESEMLVVGPLLFRVVQVDWVIQYKNRIFQINFGFSDMVPEIEPEFSGFGLFGFGVGFFGFRPRVSGYVPSASHNERYSTDTYGAMANKGQP